MACKAMAEANDHVRTSIRYSVEEVEIVRLYLQKLPSLTKVAVDWDDAKVAAVSSCLDVLYSIVPGLNCLVVRWGISQMFFCSVKY